MRDDDLTQVLPTEAVWRAPLSRGPDPLAALYPHKHGLVRLGLIASANGKATAPDGSSSLLSGPADARVMRVLRDAADVVVVGSRTALRERYRDIPSPPDTFPGPDLAIVSRSGAIPPGLDPHRTWLVTTANAPALARSPVPQDRIIIAGFDIVEPEAMMMELRNRGRTRVLCEGGPIMARALMSAGVIDEVCLSHSPVAGDEEAAELPDVTVGLVLAHLLSSPGGYTMERWVRPDVSPGP